MNLEHREQKNQATKVPMLDALGMEVTEIDLVPALRSGMEMVAGLIVKMVKWGGVADQSGVATGDIITEVNEKPARTLNDLHDLLAAHNGREPIRFLFRREGTTRYLALPCEGGHFGENFPSK